MRVLFLPDWQGVDASTGLRNHESSYGQTQVANLIGQVRLLEGIKDRDYRGVPSGIRTFAEQCLWSEASHIEVVKGIHQRWHSSGRQRDAKPHIRIRYHFTLGPNCTRNVQDLHVMLSEDYVSGVPSTHKNSYPGALACRWRTVGVTVVQYTADALGHLHSNRHYNTREQWPAQFAQCVDWIQENGPPQRQRRLSIGCLPPPVMPTVVRNAG